MSKYNSMKRWLWYGICYLPHNAHNDVGVEWCTPYIWCSEHFTLHLWTTYRVESKWLMNYIIMALWNPMGMMSFFLASSVRLRETDIVSDRHGGGSMISMSVINDRHHFSHSASHSVCEMRHSVCEIRIRRLSNLKRS